MAYYTFVIHRPTVIRSIDGRGWGAGAGDLVGRRAIMHFNCKIAPKHFEEMHLSVLEATYQVVVLRCCVGWDRRGAEWPGVDPRAPGKGTAGLLLEDLRRERSGFRG